MIAALLTRPLRGAGFCALLGLGVAFAFGPMDAYRAALANPDRDAQIDLERARGDYERTRIGVYAELEIDPAIGWGGDLDEDPGLLTDLSAEASVGYRYDPYDLLEEEIDLLEAERDVAEEQRGRVQNYLDIYGDLLRLQLRVADRRERLAAERAALSATEAQEDVDASDLERARNDVDEAALALDLAERSLANLRARAATVGLEGDAVWDPVIAELPEPDARATATYRILQLRVALAELSIGRDGVFRVLERLELTGLYESRSDGYQVSATADLDEGRPGLAVAAEYDGQGSDAWRVVLSADIRVDTVSAAVVARARVDLDAARDDLESYLEFFPIRASETRVALDGDYAAYLAERDTLTRAEGFLADLIAEAEAAGERLAELEAALARGDASEDDVLRARDQLVNLERRVRNARADVRDDRDDLYDAWLDYLVEVEDYLDVLEQPWSLVAPR